MATGMCWGGKKLCESGAVPGGRLNAVFEGWGGTGLAGVGKVMVCGGCGYSWWE